MNKFESMSFRKDFLLPIEEQDRMLGFTKWGKKNDYPYFLVDLYNGSAWHQGIIKNKTHYIAGGGVGGSSAVAFSYLDSPGTTSPVTYKMQQKISNSSSTSLLL